MRAHKDILLVGATEYAAVFMDAFEDTPGITFTGCVQNICPEAAPQTILGKDVYWTGDIAKFRKSHELICILATTLRKSWLTELAADGYTFASLVHPQSHVSVRSEIGCGVSVDAGSVIAGFSRIGDHVRVGRRVSIGHHTTIGAYGTIHPGAIVSGKCQISQQVMIGAGAVILDNVDIGEGAVVAAGAVVRRSVPAYALVAGHPARVMPTLHGPR
jgi:sugar O-acyltransferase (sialic acid O-acetyltransferase NeuD family)